MREMCGWTQREAAERLGVQQPAVARWESGRSVPPVNRVAEIARVYGWILDYDVSAVPIDDALHRGITLRVVKRVYD